MYYSVNTVYATAEAVSPPHWHDISLDSRKVAKFDTAIVARLASQKELIQYDKSSWHLCSPAARAQRGGARARVGAEAEAGAGATAVLQEHRPRRRLHLLNRRKASPVAANRKLLLVAR